MWIINGAQPGTGRVRQHTALSYFMSDDEIMATLGGSVRLGAGPAAHLHETTGERRMDTFVIECDL
jgi:hypothetical protein